MKCVMVLDENLPVGVIANTAAIPGISLGRKMPDVVGGDVTSQDGVTHAGIITLPVPVLRGSPEQLCHLTGSLPLLGRQTEPVK